MSANVKLVSKYKLLCQGDNGYLFYKSGKLYFSDQLRRSPRLLSKLQSTPVRNLLSRFRLTERLLRLEPRFAVPHQGGFMFSWSGAMRFVDISTGQIRSLHTYRSGMNNPLAITRIENVSGFTDGYVYGEYWGNTKRLEVGIYRIKEFDAECVFSFKANQILHIHGIAADPKNDRLLIFTGDRDSESGIWEARNDFKEVRPLLIGTQFYRTCAAYPTDEGLLYATDTPLLDNGIYLYREGRADAEKIYDMPGPCIYSKSIESDGKPTQYVFATSVEPDSRLPARRYKLTYRLGAGVKSRWVHIVVGSPKEGFKTVFRMKKDLLPMVLFQFGNCYFPHTSSDEPLLCTPLSVRRYHNKTIQIHLGDNYAI